MINVNDVMTLKADPVLGSEAEPVRVVKLYADRPRVVQVLQLTDANGVPGWFDVSVDELEVTK